MHLHEKASRVAKTFRPEFIRDDLRQPHLARALDILIKDLFATASSSRLAYVLAAHPENRFIATFLKDHEAAILDVFEYIPVQEVRGLHVVVAA